LNRAAKYGDGFFETILIYHGKVPFVEFHLDRIFKTAQFLALQIPPHFDKFYFDRLVNEKCDPKGIFRLRIQFSRAGEGFYFPESNQVSIEKDIIPITEPFSLINRFNHPVHFFKSIKSSSAPYWNFKTCNSLPYILPAIEAQKSNVPDLLLLNNENQPIEWIYSNLFLYKDHELTTTPLGSGCLDGVMRRALIEWCNASNFKVFEKSISIEDVRNARVILKTNAITGMCISGDESIEPKLLKLLTKFQAHYLNL
jgi:branched-chain amino acid aminotransferase